jgi:hypothetical protein
MRCPQCGGEVRPEEEDAFVHCAFCGSSLYLDPGGAVRHEVLPALIARADLPGRLGRWLQDREAVGSPSNIATRLVYFPFWVLPAPQESRLVPAAPLLLQDMERFRLPSGDFKTFRDDRVTGGELVPASVLVESLVPADEGPPKGTRLVHLPFWETGFRIASKECTVWVDAASGQVLALHAPVSSEARLDRIYSGLLATTYVALLAGFLLLFAGGVAIALGLLLLAVAGPGALALARRAIAREESG